VKIIKRSILLSLLVGLQAVSAGAHEFGKIPLQDVQNIAMAVADEWVNKCTPGDLTYEKLFALMLTPTWGETTEGGVGSPSPMTLSRSDNGATLYALGDAQANYPFRRAFWHTGIGAWQLDDFGLGSPLGIERFTNAMAADAVAEKMATKYCGALNNSTRLMSVFSSWNSCDDKSVKTQPNTLICERLFNAIYNPVGAPLIATDPMVVDEYGGGELRTCSLAGQVGTFPCLYIDPSQAEGATWWAMQRINGTPPLAKPFYVYRQDAGPYEWRYWMVGAATGFGENIAAARAYGKWSECGLCWMTNGALSSVTNLTQKYCPSQSWDPCQGLSAQALCDLTTGVGACSNTPQLRVSLLASPSSGPAPLNGVTLQANVTGNDPNQVINYTFYCNRSDAGTNITPNPDQQFFGIWSTQRRALSLCHYPTAGSYTAKVIVQQGNNSAAEALAPITVGGSPSGCFSLTLAANNLAGGAVPSAAPPASSSCALGEYLAGAEIQLTAAPASGWAVGSWVGTQNDTSTSETNSLVMPASSHTVIVNYVQSAPSPITILTTSVPDAAPNQPYSVQLTASGGTGTGYVWSLQAGNLPFGLTLNAQAGVISGTPTQAGTSSDFTIGVRDSGGNSTDRRYSLYVQQTPGPTITSSAPSSFVFSVGAPYTRPNSITYLAEGGQAPYSWQATGLPPGLQIDPAGGFLYGTPVQAGSFPAEIMVSDALGESASLAATLRVVVNALIITDSSGHTPPNPPAGTLGTSYQFIFAAQGGSLSGYTWSISQGSLPPGLVAEKPPGCTSSTCALLISGTPTQGGTFSFTVMVRDSLGDVTSQGATIIINTGTPPVIQTVRLPIATIGSTYSTSLAATGGTPGYRWSFAGASPDPGIQLSASGILSGTSSLTNDCPTGATDGGAIWVGTNYPTRYFSVQVTDAAGQSATTNLCLVSYHPLPQLTDSEPPSVIVDGQDHTITVHGTNLRNDSMLEIGSNAPSPTTYVNPTTVTFNLYPAPTGFATSPGGSPYGETTYALKVVQPYASFATSSINFSIFDPPPNVSSVSSVLNNTNQPCRANLSCQLVINGTGFVDITSYLIVQSGQTIYLDDHPSTPIPWTQVTVGAFSVPTPGTYTLRVTNGFEPNGQPASVDVPFTVQP
jgi:hypothetical protein